MPGTTATLAGITFGGPPDGNGVSYRLETVKGWTDTPGVRQSTEERVGVDGQILLESNFSGRALLIKGKIAAPTAAALWGQMNALTAALGGLVGANGTLVVNEPAPKQMAVRLAPPGAFVDPVSDQTAEFEIPLIAVDPFKYSVGSTTVTFV